MRRQEFPLSVLILESDPRVARLISRLLDLEGHRSRLEFEGSYGQSVIYRSPRRYDLLITEQRLDIPGLKVAQLCKSYAPDLVVLFETSVDLDDLRRDPLYTDEYLYLQKPFSNEDFMERMREAQSLVRRLKTRR